MQFHSVKAGFFHEACSLSEIIRHRPHVFDAEFSDRAAESFHRRRPDRIAIGKAPRMEELQKGNAPEMFMAAEADGIKKAVPHVPVIAAGHLQTPGNCEMLLEKGSADLIGLARVLFADAAWLRKASGEMPDAIRACVQCHNCMRQIIQRKPAFCSRWSKEDRTRFLKDIPLPQEGR
jgi:2,4-dienoyl-CoA reductase-like NADH-dependent reductase (Old Yellow Enzyme family)